MTAIETAYDLFERFGVPGAIAEAGDMVEKAATIQDEQHWSDVLDTLLDIEEEEA